MLGLAAAAVVACQERLAGPADCPNLCPGGYQLRDTVLSPLQNQDSSFLGYVLAGQGTSLRVSWQFPVSEDRSVVRFIPRPDSFTVSTDSLLPYTIDSVQLSFQVAYRDTSVKNLYVYIYRLPATVDSSYTFAEADSAFTPASIIDSFHVSDDSVIQTLADTLRGAALSRVAIAQADTGILAIGFQIRAASGTGIRLTSAGTGAPTFRTFVTVKTGDTTTVSQTFARGASFQRFLSMATVPFDPTILTVGGVPSARTIMRFPWPEYLKDSAQLIRATLELIPTGPIPGLNGDTAHILVDPVLADFGAKSPTTTVTTNISTVPILAGQTDTVRIEMLNGIGLWQGTTARPPALMLQLAPEGSSFTRATFGSTRTPAIAPILRLTYALRYPFDAP